MSFTYPLALLLLLLLIPVALLYWLRLRVPQVVVGTSPFWQQALAEEPLRARWQQWRTPVSLVLHMLTVILLVLAAAGPAMPPPRRIVLILDNSATMRATDVQPTRFEAAKEAARRLIESLRWCDKMAIVVTNGTQMHAFQVTGVGKLLHIPEESQPLTSNRALLRAAIDAVQPVAEPPAIQCAINVAREIGPWDGAPLPVGPNSAVILTPEVHPGDNDPPRIVLITDGCAADATREAQKSGVEVLRIGTSADNRAITCFTARRTKVDPEKCEVFVEVQNRGDRTAEGKLELAVDDKPGPSVAFAIEKDGRWSHLFDGLHLPDAARLTAKITPSDAYPFDDTTSLVVPAPIAVGLAKIADKQSSWNDLIAHPVLPRAANQQASAAGEGGLAVVYRGILLSESHRAAPLSPMLYAEFMGPLYGEPNGVDIRVRSDAGSDAADFSSVSSHLPLWVPLAAAAALVLVLEWCLCQRRWTS
jgi:hypothetical protein